MGVNTIGRGFARIFTDTSLLDFLILLLVEFDPCESVSIRG